MIFFFLLTPDSNMLWWTTLSYIIVALTALCLVSVGLQSLLVIGYKVFKSQSYSLKKFHLQLDSELSFPPQHRLTRLWLQRGGRKWGWDVSPILSLKLRLLLLLQTSSSTPSCVLGQGGDRKNGNSRKLLFYPQPLFQLMVSGLVWAGHVSNGLYL